MSGSQGVFSELMPMIALRGFSVFPNIISQLDVIREKSIKSVEYAVKNNKNIFFVNQKNVVQNNPEREDLYNVGVVAAIKQVQRSPGNGGVRILVEGVCRARCRELVGKNEVVFADVEALKDCTSRMSAAYKEAIIRRTHELFTDYAQTAVKIPPDVVMGVMSTQDIGHLADYIISNIPVDTKIKQSVIEQVSPLKRIKYVLKVLDYEKQILVIDSKIEESVRVRIDDNQREYYLREQLKAISDELADGEDDEYSQKIDELKTSEKNREKLRQEAARIAKMPAGSHEAAVIRSYIDTCLDLPWGKETVHRIDLEESRKILDRDHYGLEKVKQRILEFLAVYTLVPEIKGQIICLVGPPGVGKSSIAKGIADCMGRKYERVSLGGISDESEIRGHRKTYIGAMPGRIINAVKNAGSCNPVILLDEIDKLGYSYKGDPSAALLEVLDPEQNAEFCDRYVEIPFDLSKAIFITTANTTATIPTPLLDRMEVIELSSYTSEEKFNIAKVHIIKKQLNEFGLSGKNFRMSDKAIHTVIDEYTHEAGVRRLKNNIAAICRKAAVEVVADSQKKVSVTPAKVREYLGTPKFKKTAASNRDEVGLVNGLAWTSVGGVMMRLEVVSVKGSGKLEITGSLGDVMQESAKAAVTYVRSRADKFSVNSDFYKENDIHIHADEAAVPKDGPSAGVTMATALVSCLTGIPVRHDVAMTGEITLLGRVLPIGGLREKAMAAYKEGIKTVFIPIDNVADLDEVDEIVKKNVEFVPVENIDQIIKTALVEDASAKSKMLGVVYTPRKELA